MACVTLDSRHFGASYWNVFVISRIEFNIFLNAIFCTTVQIADCLLLTLSEGLSVSVFDCRFGMNLDKLFKTRMNDLSCFRVLGGVSGSKLTRFPKALVNSPLNIFINLVKFFYKSSHILLFKTCINESF